MIHHKKGARPDSPGPAAYFSGSVTLTPVIEAPDPARIRALVVSFKDGARTFWHTHPLGQTIHILEGHGQAQREGGPVIDLHPGDTVFFEPGERHWHGAAPSVDMVHFAFQEALDGVSVTWQEEVV